MAVVCGKIRFKGVLTNMSVNWIGPVRGNHYMMAEVPLSFTAVGRDSPTASQVRQGRGLIIKWAGRVDFMNDSIENYIEKNKYKRPREFNFL